MIRRLVAALLVVLVVAACSDTTQGGPSPVPGPPVVDEAGATWAVAQLDPCTLLSPDVVDGLGDAGDPYLVAPHACAVDHTRADGVRDRLVVEVGAAFDTAGRAAATPVTLGDVHAYLTRDVPAPATAPATDRATPTPTAAPTATPAPATAAVKKGGPRCVAAIPISATRAIEVDAAAVPGDDAVAACATTTAVGQPLAAKLGSPADRVRTAVPGDLGRYDACGLLQAALGVVPDRDAYSSPTADSCRATNDPQQQGPDSEVELSIAAGPATLGAPGLGTSSVATKAGPAQQTALPSGCRVVVLGQPLPDAPAAAAAQVVTFTERQQADDPCAEAVTDVESVLAKAAGEAPDAPPVPARLGYPVVGPDDLVPVACGVPEAGPADSCRSARTVEAPTGASALLAQAVTGPTAADTTCAVLRAVAQPITGDLELAAVDGVGCLGLAADGYTVKLGLTESSADDACSGGESVVVAGRSGVRCRPSDDTFDLTVPARGSTADGRGALHVDGRLLPPRGDRTRVRPHDQAHVSDVTRRLAEAVTTAYLQAG